MSFNVGWVCFWLGSLGFSIANYSSDLSSILIPMELGMIGYHIWKIKELL